MERAPATRTIALVGNMGVGKTTLYEKLQHGSKPPKSKIKRTRGPDVSQELPVDSMAFSPAMCDRESGSCCKKLNCANTPTVNYVDTPGTSFLLAGKQPNEAVKTLLDNPPDAIAVVADAKNLRRSIALFLEAVEFDVPAVMIVNMMDEAKNEGLEIDLDILAQELGVPVRAAVAVNSRSVKSLPKLVENTDYTSKRALYPEHITAALGKLNPLLSNMDLTSRALGLLLLTGNPAAEALVEKNVGKVHYGQIADIVQATRAHYQTPIDVILSTSLLEAAGHLAEVTSRRVSSEPRVLQQLGYYATHPFFGVPIAFAVLYLGYLFVGEIGASLVVDTLNVQLFEGILLPFFAELTSHLPYEFARNIFMDPDFGLIPTALFLALGIVLPVLFFFFLFFGLLESSGYLSRLCIMMDRLLRKLGLNGKGVLPLVFGFSCVTTAILTTRILPSKKERTIATLLLLLGFPCAPLLAVMFVVLAPLPKSASFMLFGMLGLQITVAGILANRFFKGRLPDFVMEMPRLRLPKLQTVIPKAVKQSVNFVKEALPIFMAASLLLFVANHFGALDALERGARPLVHGLLGLPDQAVQVFVKTIIRRENGAAELAMIKGQFNPLQLVITLYVMTILTPCVNAAIVVIKERGVRLGATIMCCCCGYAFVAGSGLHWVCRVLGVNFIS